MRGDRERLEDMLEVCQLIRTEITGRSDELRSHPVLQAAAQRWIEIIGEAAANVSENLRQQHPELPWRGVIGMRNILIHGYFHLDVDAISRVVDHDIPAFGAAITSILEELD